MSLPSRDETNFHGESVAQQHYDLTMHFHHHMLVEIKANVRGISNDDWEKLAEYLRLSLYSSVGNSCGRDDAVQIDSVDMNPNDVSFAEGFISNSSIFHPDKTIYVTIPVLLEMSCVVCNPDQVVILEGEPQLPMEGQPRYVRHGPVRRNLVAREHFMTTRFFCKGGSTAETVLDYYTRVKSDSYGFGNGGIDVLYVADMHRVVDNCWNVRNNTTVQEFDYTMYFKAQSDVRARYTPEALQLYEETFKHIYNEASVRNWRVCDTFDRIVTNVTVVLPDMDWAEGDEIIFEVVFHGNCVNCEPEGCLIEFPLEGWPAKVFPPSDLEWQTGRPLAVPRPERVSASPYRARNEGIVGDARNRVRPGLARPETTPSNFVDEYSPNSLHENYRGECLCNTYATQERPTMANFVSKMFEAFSGLDFDVAFSEPLEMWEEDPSICNTCCGWPKEYFPPIQDGELFHAASDYYYNFEATSYGHPINCWDVSLVRNFDSIFTYFFPGFNDDLSCWDTSSGTTFRDMFRHTPDFNSDSIAHWDMSKATSLSGMFDFAVGFNQDINSWNVSNVIDFAFMFKDTHTFNQPLDNWRPLRGERFSGMFENSIFNHPIGLWTFDEVSETNMELMFKNNPSFDQNLNDWDTSKTTSFFQMFMDTVSFNHPVSSWETSRSTDFGYMFYNTPLFNQPVNNFNVTNAQWMDLMFYNCLAFNQPLDSWTPNNAFFFFGMFLQAESFNQDLCHFTQHINSSTLIEGGQESPLEFMFHGTNCPNQADPVVGFGPFCYDCMLLP